MDTSISVQESFIEDVTFETNDKHQKDEIQATILGMSIQGQRVQTSEDENKLGMFEGQC